MRRRDFIALAGGTVVAWSPAVDAQGAPKSVIGFLNSASAEPFAPMVAAFHRGLIAASLDVPASLLARADEVIE
jgi:hypothetical protein